MVLKCIDRAPKIAAQVEERPREKSLADLSDAEMKTLAKLMKVDVQTLTENRDAWAMPPVEVEAPPSDDWSAPDDDTDAAIEDPAYDRDNWSDRKSVG